MVFIPAKLCQLPQAPRLQLRGGGNPPKGPKYAKTNDHELQKLLTLIRSLGLWKSLEHDKCPLAETKIRDNLCSFCLTRSLMVKLNMRDGRTKLIPTEVMKILPGGVDMRTMLSNLITEITKSCPDVLDKIITNLKTSNH